MKMTIAELSKIFQMRDEIQVADERLEELRQRAYNAPSAYLSDMPHSTYKESRVERSAIDIENQERELVRLMRQFIRQQIKIEKWICTIPDSFLRLAFELRFVSCLRWEDIEKYMKRDKADAIRMAMKRYLDKKKT